MNDNLLVLRNKFTYVQETSLPKINDNVIANGSVLSRLFDKLKYIQETSLPTVNDNILSGNSYLSRLFDKLNYIQVTSLPTVNDNLLWYRGLFVKDGYTFSFWTLSNISEKIRLSVKSLDDRSALILERLSALDALGVRLSSIGNQLGDIGTSMSSSLKWLEVFHGDLSMLRHGRASISLDEADYTVWDWLHDIDYSLGNVSQLLQGVQETLTAWGNRWDSQDLYLMEWAKRWDARPQPSFSFDDGAILAKLDSIRSLLTVSAAKDVLDGLVGDLNLDATEAASAAVGSAIQNAFPFCVPAVLKQILGLLQADPSPPEFHFDFWGAPLDFGFSDWQGLADMTSWLSRIGFAVVLFANSRRFVYSGGVAGD